MRTYRMPLVLVLALAACAPPAAAPAPVVDPAAAERAAHEARMAKYAEQERQVRWWINATPEERAAVEAAEELARRAAAPK